jgi:hypothetical protein
MAHPLFITRRAALRRLTAGLGALALSACSLPTAPAQSTATTAPTNPASTATAIPAATETSAPIPTQTAEPTSATGGQPPVISKANLNGLSEQSFTVPVQPGHYIWLGPDVVLNGLPDPRPDLLLQAGPELHPIRLNPFGLGQPLPPLPLNGTEALAFAPDGSSVVIKDPTRTALFSLDGPIIRELPSPAEAYGASYSRDGRYLVITSAGHWEANVYDLAADPAAPPVVLTGFETAAPVYSVIVAPGGQVIAWHARARLVLQDVASGQMGAEVSYPDFINTYEFSPDGSKLALDVAGKLYIYSVPGLQELASLELAAGLSSLDWSPDGTLLAAAYNNGLQLWDSSTLEPLISLPGPNPYTGMAQFSPDGRYIATIHEDNLFGIWSTK